MIVSQVLTRKPELPQVCGLCPFSEEMDFELSSGRYFCHKLNQMVRYHHSPCTDCKDSFMETKENDFSCASDAFSVFNNHEMVERPYQPSVRILSNGLFEVDTVEVERGYALTNRESGTCSCGNAEFGKPCKHLKMLDGFIDLDNGLGLQATRRFESRYTLYEIDDNEKYPVGKVQRDLEGYWVLRHYERGTILMKSLDVTEIINRCSQF